jgi:type IV pilus assembly protein PilY1
MKNQIIKTALVLVSMAWSLQATAADTDLFLGNVPAPTTSAPNVLFIIDNTGNWTSPFDEEQAALVSVFEGIKAKIEDETDNLSINVGLMFFAESGGTNDGVGSGGYVRAAVRPMGDKDENDVLYAQLYGELIGELQAIDDKGNAGAGGLAMAEAYHYFAGLEAYAGNQKAKSDFTGNDFINSNGSCCEETHPVWGLPGSALNAFGTSAGQTYNSPIAPGSCGKNYIIWISNGATADPNSSSRDAYALLEAAAGEPVPQITGLSNIRSQDNWADEWAHFMLDPENPVQITTYTIDVLPDSNNQGRGWTALLQSMAIDENRYYSVDGSEDGIGAQLVATIADITGDILAVNSVFASVALPAASNAQSTFLNQVFIGQFRPDADALPLWPGNMKQYQIGYRADGSSLTMQDADGVSVVHPNTGFLENCARSFWSTADTYWSDALDLGLTNEEYCAEATAVSNAPDGPIVEKGAHGQMLRATSPAARTVYTCDPVFADCNALTSFNTGNGDISATLLNVASADKDDTINWARGEDIDDEDEDPLTNGNMRASAHGDVVHSRPVALNYNTQNEPQVVVFYSGNEGMLRAINGNQLEDTDRVDPTGIDPGEEIWSFMPPEFWPYIDTLRTNEDQIKFPASGTSAPATGISKPYGIDGTITALEGYVPAAAADKKYLFAGMRRGGRAVYAFDVSSVTSPQLLWKKGCPNLANDTDCITGWSDIGQTWSQMNLLYARGYNAGLPDNDLKPMLIMGGGYDDCEDYDNNTTANHNCTSSTKGNQVYILDAYDGSILKTLPTDRAVVGGVTVVPYGQVIETGIMFAYAVDMGGNLYRISGGTTAAPLAIDTAAPADWVIKKVASLGCDTAAGGCTANRKFLFGPDVVRVPGSTDQFAVLVGSGDREKPLVNYGAAASVDNYFFAVFDHATDAAWLDDDANGNACSTDILCLDSLTSVTVENGVADGETLSPKGWRLPLSSGEQVVTGALTAFNIANFSTHRPAQPDDACTSSLGTATAYNLSYKDGEGRSVEFDGGGLPPTPVIGKVIIEIIDDDGNITTKTEDVCITCGGLAADGTGSIFEVAPTGSGALWDQPTSRVYWNIQQ